MIPCPQLFSLINIRNNELWQHGDGGGFVCFNKLDKILKKEKESAPWWKVVVYDRDKGEWVRLNV